MVTQLQDALQLMMSFYGNSLFYFQAFFFKDVFHFLDFKTLNNLHKFWKNFAKFIAKDLFRSFFLNPFLGNVPLTDKLGNWFLVAKCLKNTCGEVTFWAIMQVNDLHLYLKCHSSAGVFHELIKLQAADLDVVKNILKHQVFSCDLQTSWRLKTSWRLLLKIIIWKTF